MQLQEFVEKFADCFHHTNHASISSETRFSELDEWGSMMTLIVIAMIDSDYEKTITSEDLKKATTVADLFEIVKNK